MIYVKPMLSQRPAVPELYDRLCIYLFEACDLIGKQSFGDQWTGRELLARVNVGTGIPDVCRDSGDWVVQSRCGKQRFSDEAEANAEHIRAAAVVQELATAERDARRRFVEVVRELQAWLSEELRATWEDQKPARAFVFDRRTGARNGVPVNFWRSDDGRRVFEMRDLAAKWAAPNFVHIRGHAFSPTLTGNVIVPKDRLLELAGVQPRPAPPVTPALVIQPEEVQTANRRAATPKDFQEFGMWAAHLAQRRGGLGPDHDEAYLDFAKPRGLSRDGFVRKAIPTLPNHLRRERGSGAARE